MTLIVGLDTGGTYTDGVLFDPEQGVLRSGKSLTTKHDLSIGLGGALGQVLPEPRETIDLVCLSTTLATNAVVEGHGNPVGLLLIGFEDKALERGGLGEALGGDPVAFIGGGHGVFGEEKHPLDTNFARKAIEEMAPNVSGFAIAGMFAVRNSEHERKLRELVFEITDRPVTCSHELSSKLDAPKRALTTVLNARLIPQLQQLIHAVQDLMEQTGIRAPLMIVKGDGSLEDAAIALLRPVETILSGPAASLVGAHYLSGEDDGMVVDMGGTTTDIALMNDGMPLINEAGATVGGWSTMVEAVSIHTFGLGGDSEVRVEPSGSVSVGPRRCMPISLLAQQHPEVIKTLEDQLSAAPQTHHGRFAARLRVVDPDTLPATQRRLWNVLEQGPVALRSLQSSGLTGHALDALVNRGLVIYCGFTPSDASHVLGLQTGWSARAAELAALLWVRKQTDGDRFDGAEALSRRVLEVVTRRSGRCVIDSLIAESSGYELNRGGDLASALVDWYLAPQENRHLLFRPVFQIDRPLVAIGAPVATYYPAVAERLDVKLRIPPHAEIANAVGAAAAGIMQVVRILVSRPSSHAYRVHLIEGVKDFEEQDEAFALARQTAASAAVERAEQAGAIDIEVSESTQRKTYRSDLGDEVLLEGIVTAKALGRPRLAG